MRKCLLVLLSILILSGCQQKIVLLDDLKTTMNDMTSYETVHEPTSHFFELTLEESFRLFDEGGSGILMLSRDNCPHCLCAMPVMIEMAEKHDLTIYYVDCKSGIDSEQLEKLEAYASEVLGKRGVMIPIVISIINGKAVGSHIGTVAEADGLLDEEQKTRTIQIYEELLADWIK